MGEVIYIAKQDTWFDAGTEVQLISDYRTSDVPLPCGLFCGLVDGKEDEEICDFDEFDIIEAGR